MAATVSAWGKPGAWALDAEQNESALLHQTQEDHSAAETPDFPSLSAGASSKTKKKKPQALSLQEFSAYSSGKPKGLTHDELSALPTGPRERSAEELDRNKLGGGFRSYGGRDEQPRRQGSFNRELAPSRADETDDWGANKKSSANSGSERRERGGFFGDSQSRADEVDNWATNKNSEARRYEKRGGLGMESGDGGSDSSNWGKRSGGAFDSLRDRRGGMEADPESWGRKREESGGNRPRLNLQPRTLPVNEEGSNSAVKSKGSSNPFGEARPREEVLKDKAQDIKQIEERLEGVSVDSAESVWRKPGSVDPPQSAGETEADNDDSENKDCEI
ncbi:eukaryotic translation initiation factor 4B3-like [Salvia hispanica]|uniref:eukaryotic translation initiation factor 4B3-like n=1 Tax=Salvia hispanica TaxID=49212 RepID=UPI0020095A98|nr:eukaryotic translation initiation factor 4B3-like [Salvia hispanica]